MSVRPDQLPAGILIGHWSDPVGRTGCTVVLAPEGAVGGVDVRGAAPADARDRHAAPGDADSTGPWSAADGRERFRPRGCRRR